MRLMASPSNLSHNDNDQDGATKFHTESHRSKMQTQF